MFGDSLWEQSLSSQKCPVQLICRAVSVIHARIDVLYLLVPSVFGTKFY